MFLAGMANQNFALFCTAVDRCKVEVEMADADYEEKLQSLRRYIPFLKNMMIELKAKGNRQAQLIKIQSLFDMITDTRKKLKIETLIRCEEVLTNIYVKVNPQIKSSKNVMVHMDSANNFVGSTNPPSGYDDSQFKDFPCIASPSATPRSPSPIRNIVLNEPVNIPTEKLDFSASRSKLNALSKECRPKIEVYSNVVIKKPSNILQKTPDMSKPPISLDDLKNLEEDVLQKMSYATFANKSVSELQEYKKQLQLQLKVDELNSAMGIEASIEEDFINPTARNVPTPSSRLSYSETKARRNSQLSKRSCSNLVKEVKPAASDEKSAKSTRLDSFSKAPLSNAECNNSVTKTDIFGNLLSSIDEKIIKDKKKTKKTERRSSVSRSKEDSGSSGIPPGKSLEKNIEEKSKLSSKDQVQDRIPENSKSLIESDNNLDQSTTVTDVKAPENKKLSPSRGEVTCNTREDKISESQNNMGKRNVIVDVDHEKVVPGPGSKCSSINKTPTNFKPGLIVDGEFGKTTRPTFKRLADKYNPKPKPKPVEDDILDIDKVVSDDIEKSMKASSIQPLIPALDSFSDANEQQNSVQLPSILQNFFKPLFRDNLKIVPPAAESPSCASMYQHVNSEAAIPNTLLSPDQSFLSSPRKTLIFQPPSTEHRLGHIGNMSSSNMLEKGPNTSKMSRASVLTYPDCGSSILPTPGPGILSQSPFPSSNSHGGFIDQGLNMSFGTPRADFDSPCTPRANFELSHTDAAYINTDQYSLGQCFDSSHLDSTYANMDQYSLGQHFESAPFDSSTYAGTDQYAINQRFISPVSNNFGDQNFNFSSDQSFNRQGGFFGNNQTSLKFDPPQYTPEQNYQPDRFRWFKGRRSNDPRSYREYRAMKERQEREARAVEERQRDMQRPSVNRDPRLLTRGESGESNFRDKSEILIKDPRLSAGRERSMDRSSNTNGDCRESNDSANMDEKHSSSKIKSREDKARNKESSFQSDSPAKTQNDKYKSSKLDEIYSKTNSGKSRSTSSNRRNSNKDESFVSPLESLYSYGEKRNTSEGSGFKKFRIPRKSTCDMESETIETEKESRASRRRTRLRRRAKELSESDESDEIIGKSDEPIQDKTEEEVHANEDISDKATSEDKSDVLTLDDKEDTSNEIKIDTTRLKVVVKSDKDNAKDSWKTRSTAVISEEIDDFISEYDREFKNSLLQNESNESVSKIADSEITNILQPSSIGYDKEVSPASIDENESNKTDADSIKTSVERTEVSVDGSTSQNTTVKNDPPTEQNILAHFFENLLKSQNKKDKKTALFSLIETFSDSFEDREIQKIRKIIKADDEDVEREEDNTDNKRDEQPVVGSTTDGDNNLSYITESEENTLIPEDSLNKVVNSVNKLHSKTQEEINPDQTPDQNLDHAFLEPIQMSVGERIKSRKRVVTKTRKKVKSELDFLHEDIQDMFIRDGVLTATGKRMCRMLKDDPNALVATKSKKSPEIEQSDKIRRKPMPKSKLKEQDFPDKSMKDMRVVINKIPDDMLSSNRTFRQVRRKPRRYADMDEELSDQNSDNTIDNGSFLESVDAVSEKSDLDEESTNESGDEKAPQSTESLQKPKIKRRKVPKWATGVISKNRKKKIQQKIYKEVSPDRSQSPVSSVVSDMPSAGDLEDDKLPEHDTSYFPDFINKQKINCKLCKYSGVTMTLHYLKEHPQSEVLCSRFPPDIAAQAINDFDENGKLLEQIIDVKLNTKYEYACRLCGYESFISPITFYEHVTTHTGEYRHQCGICKYISASSRSINCHLITNHIGEENIPKRTSYSLAIIFAYLCGECNYFQLEEKCMQTHVNKCHSEHMPTIYKINMSSITDERLVNSVSDKNNTNELGSDNTELEVSQNKEDNAIDSPSIVESRKYRKPGRKLKRRPGPKSKVTGFLEDELNVTSDNENTPLAQLCSNPGLALNRKSAEESVEKGEGTLHDNAAVVNENISPKTSRKRKRSLDKLISEDSGDDLDSIITLSSRSSRAAKQKATAKLKTLMENSDPSPPKSTTDNESLVKDKIVKEGKSSEENRFKDCVTNKKVESQPAQETQSRVGSDNLPQSAEQDLNVFTCRTDILQEDAKKIEEDRLRKMDELNKSIASRPLKLEFVNKLSEMLNNEQFVNEKLSVNVKVEPTGTFITSESITTQDSGGNIEILQPPAAFRSDQTQVMTKKPIFEDEPAVQQSDIKFNQNKPNSLFSNMIEKLQGKINEAAERQEDVVTCAGGNVEKTAPVDNQTSSTSDKILTIGGLITVTKRDDEVSYSCVANNCYVSTKDKMVFQLHCKFGHKDLKLISSLCNECGILIERTPDTTLLENVYDHLVFAHSDFLSNSNSNIRMRRLSGDKLSIKEESSKETSSVENMEKDSESTTDYVCQTASNSNSVGSEDSVYVEEALEVAEDNPFSFKIASVMSLAESNDQSSDTNTSFGIPVGNLAPLTHVPTLSLIGSTSTKQQKASTPMLVKEAKMSPTELRKLKKTPKVMKKFIETPFDLYKCPHFYCMFSTNTRMLLIRHLKIHMSSNVIAMVPCVYCDMKTPWEHVPMHIDIRHANSRFSCNKCLYRAIIREYVELHQQIAHPNVSCSVIAIPPPKAAKKFSAVASKTHIKTICEPFRCICKDEKGVLQVYEFLFERDFTNHFKIVHPNSVVECNFNHCMKKVSSSAMLSHWSQYHGIFSFHCAYCRTSGKDLSMLYFHFAHCHPNLMPDILDRKTHPESNEDLGFSEEAFKQIRHIKKIPSNISTKENPLPSTFKLLQQTSPIEPFVQAPGSSGNKEITSSTITTTTAGTSLLLKSRTSLPDVSATSSQASQLLLAGSNLQLIVSTKSGNKDTLYLVPASVVSAVPRESVNSTGSKDNFSVKTATVSPVKFQDQPKEPVRIGNITIYPDESALCKATLQKSQPKPIVPSTSLLTHSTPSVHLKKESDATSVSNRPNGSEQTSSTNDCTLLSEDNEEDLLLSAIQSILNMDDQLTGSELAEQVKECALSKNAPRAPAQPAGPDNALKLPPLVFASNSSNENNSSKESQNIPSQEDATVSASQIPNSVAPVEHIEIRENRATEEEPVGAKRPTSEVPFASTDSRDPLPVDPLTETTTLKTCLPSATQDSLDVEMNQVNKAVPGADAPDSQKNCNLPKTPSMISNSDDESDSSSMERKQRGLLGYQLFRCGACNLSFSNVKPFKAHIYSSFNCKKTFKCVHCEKHFKSVQRLTDHILTHGIPRFSCSLCDEKFTIASIARHHMKSRHSLNHTSLAPLNSDQIDPEVDCFVIKPSQANAATPKEKDVANESPKSTEDNLTYAPDQIDSIPGRQIFSTNVKCGACNYQTKVRVNIMRHLQMHLDEKAVSDTAPVNPVPCLEKNEKMFDKMINFAASSITTGRMGGPAKDKKDEEKEVLYPEYVPTHRRYVCGAEGCAYLCPEESNLKHHLMALHSDDNNLICAHCKIKIEPNDIENVMKHFKLHGLHLYKCHYCRFVHHLKHKVEKHRQDNHPDEEVKVDTIRYMESEPQEYSYQDEIVNQPQFSPTKLKPWCCCMCKSKYNTREDVQAHIIRKHNVDAQYKCTLCAFKSDDEIGCQDHFKVKHPTHTFDIVLMYQKVEEEIIDEHAPTPFDTTPLWQRDKHRVRHIRGILFDDSSPQPTKSAKKIKTYSSTKTVANLTPKAASSLPLKDSPNPVGTALKSNSADSPMRSISNTSASSSSSSNTRNLWDCINAVARGTDNILTDNQPSTSGLSYNTNIEKTPQKQDLDTAGNESESNVNNREKPEESEEKENLDDSDDVIDVTQSPKVIVIDSEDSDNENVNSSNSDSLNSSDTLKIAENDSKISAPNNRGMKRSGSDLLQEALKMAKIDVANESDYALATACSKENLISLFGGLGEPHNKQWMCPKCCKFKSKRVGDFIFHIYKDFNIFRYRCKYCKDVSITYRYMQDHLKVHPVCKEDIIEPLAENIKLNAWIQMVIQKQSSVILENTPVFRKRPLTGPTDIKCYFCPKKFMSMPECCEHMLYHWVMMPYQCQHCPSEFYTIYDLKHHHKIEHPDAKIYLDPKGATLDKALQCIENIKKKEQKPVHDVKLKTTPPRHNENPTEVTGGSTVIIASKKQIDSESVQKAEEDDINTVINVEDDDDLMTVSKADNISVDDNVYACDNCVFMVDNQPEAINHLISIHGISSKKFHVLSKMKADTDLVPKMACNICEEVFSELNLRIHFVKMHSDMQKQFAPYRFKCMLCPSKFNAKVKIKNHVRMVHGVSQSSFQSVGSQKSQITRKAKYREFSCIFCNFVICSATTVPIRLHLKGHLKPIACNHCPSRFPKESEFSIHSQVCHEGIEESYTIIGEAMNELTEAMRRVIDNATPILPDSDRSKYNMYHTKKNFARKSTSTLLQRCADLPESNRNLDLSSISTTFHLNDLEYTTTAQEMMKMINMDTYVDLSECQVEVVQIDNRLGTSWKSLLV